MLPERITPTAKHFADRSLVRVSTSEGRVEMKQSFASVDELRSFYNDETLSLQQTFSRTGDGIATIRRRSHLVDTLVRQALLLAAPGAELPMTMAAIAVGGYGRRELFPCSDVDVLYLFTTPSAEEAHQGLIRGANQIMWDIGLRASPIARAVKECERFHPGNVEFTLSLLDARFVTGSEAIAQGLQINVLPALVPREWTHLTEDVAELARTRHTKYGETIFQLEPNIKEAPGGLRDHNLAHWLQSLLHIRENGELPNKAASVYPAREDSEAAFEFLAATRCFLHLRNGRDDNTLSWDAQDEAAAQSVGLETVGSADPSYWMRTYYRHARAVYRRVALMLDALPATRLSFYKTIRPAPCADRRHTIPFSKTAASTLKTMHHSLTLTLFCASSVSSQYTVTPSASAQKIA